jgi:N-glycosylase/DNA lyase
LILSIAILFIDLLIFAIFGHFLVELEGRMANIFANLIHTAKFFISFESCYDGKDEKWKMFRQKLTFRVPSRVCVDFCGFVDFCPFLKRPSHKG